MAVVGQHRRLARRGPDQEHTWPLDDVRHTLGEGCTLQDLVVRDLAAILAREGDARHVEENRQ